MPTPPRHRLPNLPNYFLGRPAARYVERYGRRRPVPTDPAPGVGR